MEVPAACSLCIGEDGCLASGVGIFGELQASSGRLAPYHTVERQGPREGVGVSWGEGGGSTELQG